MAVVDNRKAKEDLDETIDEVVNTADDTPEEAQETSEPEESETVEEATVEETPAPKKKLEPKKEEPDYKEKFAESTREAQVLSAKNRKLTEIIDKASEIPEPTERELLTEYPEWDEMSTLEQRLAKNDLVNRKKFELVQDVVRETKNIDQWAQKIDTFLEESGLSDSHPELEGRDDAFRKFAMKPTRRGSDVEDLVSAFLYQVQPEVKHKGSLLETGTGGPKEIRAKELTPEEIKTLRTKDPRKYKQMIQAGKIDIQI